MSATRRHLFLLSVLLAPSAFTATSQAPMTYPRRVERVADSAYYVSGQVFDLINRSILPTLANQPAKLNFSLDSSAKLSDAMADGIKRHTDDFDAKSPPQSLSRVHEQMVLALHELHAGADSLTTALRYRAMRDRIEYTTRLVRSMTSVMEAQTHYEAARGRAVTVALESKIKIAALKPIVPPVRDSTAKPPP